MACGWFITGTDTDVGKTALTAALALALAERGSVATMKPVQTGADPDAPDLVAVDRLLAAGGYRSAGAPDARLPYAFSPPCSPHLAAAQAGEVIELNRIHSALARLQNEADTVLVEGAGGLRVPMGPHHEMIDLIALLELPVILATRPGLGTLNHTLLSLEALERRGLPCAGYVIVQATPASGDFIELDNIRTLEGRAGVPFLGTLPHVPGYPAPEAAPALQEAGRSILQAMT